jgi:uracil phosphoribosyltransferase
MRAGTGMVDSMLEILPTARVYHLGLYREKSTLLPVEYYNKLPAICNINIGFVCDPMIATAGTSIAAVNILKDWGKCKHLTF